MQILQVLASFNFLFSSSSCSAASSVILSVPVSNLSLFAARDAAELATFAGILSSAATARQIHTTLFTKYMADRK